MKDLESRRFERQPFVGANKGLWGVVCGGALQLVEIWWHEFVNK